MSDKYTDRRVMSQAIIVMLKNDPGAFADLSNALNIGMQQAMEEERRQGKVYYDAMIAALQLSEKKTPKELEALFIDRILEGCKGKYCGVEQNAVKKYT